MAIGPLLLIGGKENKERDPEILERFVQLCSRYGGPRIGVVTTASVEGQALFNLYFRAFRRLGVPQIDALNVDRRVEASDPALDQRLGELTGIFFTGGDQLRITSTLGGSRFHQILLQRHRDAGLTVGGTSAGASMMSHTMIVEGDANESPTKNTVKMAAGMGLWNGTVIDQHFSQRGRIGRLLSAVAQNPDLLGIGLDENTAIEVRLEEAMLTVWGESTVTVADGRAIKDTNASESNDSQPLALTGVILHVLPKGYEMDLTTRTPRQIG